MTDLTPREIVSELDRFIIGQKEAKRAVAVALRNRWRRKQLRPELREEVYPKNILMIGPTGVGKTEISRRLARLAKAPFIKVEATKFTEVGYVGRDVEQIVRDLVDAAIIQTRAEMRENVKADAERNAEARVIEAIAGKDAREQTREMFRKKLRAGELDDREITLDVQEAGGGGVVNAEAVEDAAQGVAAADTVFLHKGLRLCGQDAIDRGAERFDYCVSWDSGCRWCDGCRGDDGERKRGHNAGNQPCAALLAWAAGCPIG